METKKSLRSFEELEKLMNPTYPKPTDADIERVIDKLEARLVEKPINRHCNLAVKEGYTKSVELLRTLPHRDRKQYSAYMDISRLQTDQGRAIALLAIDYLDGQCSEETLCGVPIKKM